ncbi:dynein regulatory complex subunit 7 isoform X1 [Athalia rosae]|uniref:dynein regulatory complex subunit 7 isoform X1 n=1 Tax=Athalia rosae TaxID=37344 RepID=UPI002033AA22|nr:dynein regulatory complex subunit 7 isoform X1 [Athalia rosae]
MYDYRSQVTFDDDATKREISRTNASADRRPTSISPGALAIDDVDGDEYDDREEKSEEEEAEEEDEESVGPIEITGAILGQIERELCVVRLAWPDITREDRRGKNLPASYRSTSDKEKLLLWYAENFRRQYRALYPDRKPPLLARDNECGTQKFVSTTIRRSTLPYPELYNWQGCLKFVSDYLTYETPRDPILMPDRLCSPTRVLQRQKGNSFEFATVLCSLLLGQGYNAYVVSGYASREQVQCDRTRQACPHLPKQEEREPVKQPSDTYIYRMKPPPDMRSKFVLEMEARERRKQEDDLRRQEEERDRMILELERSPQDDYWGHRVHAWVILLPDEHGVRRDEIAEPIFLECTSGEYYFPADVQTNNLYLGVESAWNDQNYWVNMQICGDGCSFIDWDLFNISLWEHLLPGESALLREDEEEKTDKDFSVETDKHLDMPSSWVEQIEISSIAYERRYPGGSKIVLYKKAKVELYAPYVQRDGLIKKITLYEDYEYMSPIAVYETFANRADYLVKTLRNLDQETVVDCYDRGRPDACKEHRYFLSNASTNSETSLDYYDIVRLDGLARIEMHHLYLVQHFVNREDLLYYRYVQYSSERTTSVIEEYQRVLWKITEKYHRNESVPASKDIAIREFAIGDNEIRLKYHYERGKGTRATRTFIKPLPSDRGDRLIFNPDMTTGYNPDPMAPSEKSLTLYYELHRQLRDEEMCRTLIATAEDEVKTFLRGRSFEYSLPTLKVSLFDRNRNEDAKAGMFARDEALRAQSKREVVKEMDYLGPYLARLGNPEYLSKAEALQLQEHCLTDFKQKLVDRANSILEAFEKSSQELKQKQHLHTQKREFTREDEEKFQNEMNDAIFKLHTLEMQLNRCRDLAPDRYRMLVGNLRADPRLAVIYHPV